MLPTAAVLETRLRALLSMRVGAAASGRVKHVSSGVDVTSIVPPCALAISEAM